VRPPPAVQALVEGEVEVGEELSKRGTGRTLYILDEPTTGLFFHDIRQLLHVLHRLTDVGSIVL
jgi:excinuclease ABC subunit A